MLRGIHLQIKMTKKNNMCDCYGSCIVLNNILCLTAIPIFAQTIIIKINKTFY